MRSSFFASRRALATRGSCGFVVTTIVTAARVVTSVPFVSARRMQPDFAERNPANPGSLVHRRPAR